MGTVVEQLCEDRSTDIAPEQRPAHVKATPDPSSVGNPLVFYELKCSLGILKPDPALTKIQVGPDRFEMPAASPLCDEHRELTELLDEVPAFWRYDEPDLRMLSAGRAILNLNPVLRGRLLMAAAERYIAALSVATRDYDDTTFLQAQYAAVGIARALISTSVEFDREGLFDLLLYLSMRPAHEPVSDDSDRALLAEIESATDNCATLTDGERFLLHLWRGSRIVGPPLGVSSPFMAKLTQWIGDESQFYLVPGELLE